MPLKVPAAFVESSLRGFKESWLHQRQTKVNAILGTRCVYATHYKRGVPPGYYSDLYPGNTFYDIPGYAVPARNCDDTLVYRERWVYRHFHRDWSVSGWGSLAREVTYTRPTGVVTDNTTTIPGMYGALTSYPLTPILVGPETVLGSCSEGSVSVSRSYTDGYGNNNTVTDTYDTPYTENHVSLDLADLLYHYVSKFTGYMNNTVPVGVAHVLTYRGWNPSDPVPAVNGEITDTVTDHSGYVGKDCNVQPAGIIDQAISNMWYGMNDANGYEFNSQNAGVWEGVLNIATKRSLVVRDQCGPTVKLLKSPLVAAGTLIRAPIVLSPGWSEEFTAY